MFVLATRNRTFELTGLSILCAQLGVFVFALSPFQAGIWLQTEPTMVAVFAIATSAALWLAYGCIAGILQVTRLNILWICLLWWVGWQWVVTLLAPISWPSWFGPVETGIGTGWNMALLLMAVLSACLWNISEYRRTILIAATVTVCAECILHILNPGDVEDWTEWRPSRWPDYLGFTAAYIWIAAQTAYDNRKAVITCLLVILTYFIIFTSKNLTATFFMALAMLVTVIATYPRYPELIRRFLTPSGAWRRFAVLCCFLPMAWVVISPLLININTRDNVSMEAALGERDESMGARAELNHMVLATIINEPQRLLIGEGWGHFTHDSFKYSMISGVMAFKDGKLDANSSYVNGGAFHTHSEPLEALLSLGMVGFILWFAFPILVILKVPAELFWRVAPMMIAIVLLSYFWFFLPQVLAYQAVAYGALCTAFGISRQPPARTTKMQNAAIALLVVLMGWSSMEQYQAMRYGDELYFLPRQEDPKNYSVEWIERDARRGAERFRASAEYFAIWAWGDSFKTHSSNYNKEWLRYYMEAAKAISKNEQIGERYRLVYLWLQFKLLMDFTDNEHSDLRKMAADDLEDSIMLLTRLAPLREDRAAPFLMNLNEFTHGNVLRQAEILTRILTIYPKHRSALWLLGKIYATEPDMADQGKQMMARALALGVNHVYPVMPEEMELWRSPY